MLYTSRYSCPLLGIALAFRLFTLDSFAKDAANTSTVTGPVQSTSIPAVDSDVVNRGMNTVDQLEQELRLLKDEISPAQYNIISNATAEFVEQARSNHDIFDSRRFHSVIRYMRTTKLFSVPRLSPPIREQITSLVDEIIETISQHLLGDVALSVDELRHECIEYSMSSDSVSDVFLPGLRKPLTEQQLDATRRFVRSRLQQMTEYRHLLWMNDCRLTHEEKHLLWRAFARQCVRDLIITRLDKQALNEVPGYFEVRSPQSIKDGETTQNPSASSALASMNGRQRDPMHLINRSNERIYGLCLSFLPCLCMPVEESQWKEFDVEINLDDAMDTRFATHVDATCTLGVSADWLIILFGHVASNNGDLLAELQLSGKCLVFDRRGSQLFECTPGQPEMTLLASGKDQTFRGSFHLQSDYCHADLLNALNFAHSMSLVRKVHSGTSSEQYSLSVAQQTRLRKAFGKGLGTCIASCPEAGVLAIAMDSDHLTIRSRQGDAPFLEITLPPITHLYSLTPETRHGVVCTPFHLACELFAGGFTVRPQNKSQHDWSCLVAAHNGQLTIAADALQRCSQHTQDYLSRGLQSARQRALLTLHSNSYVQLKAAADQAVSMSQGTVPSQDLQAQLFLIECLEQDLGTIPQSLATYSRDARIGLMLRLGRKADALYHLQLQSQMMYYNSDRQYAHEACRFYAWLLRKLREAGFSATPEGEHLAFSFSHWSNQYPASDRHTESSLDHMAAISSGNGFELQDNNADIVEGVSDGLFIRIDEELKRLVEDVGPSSETSLYIVSQLDCLWEEFPTLRLCKEEAAIAILEFWRLELEALQRDKRLPIKVAAHVPTLIWQTYHCLRTSHYPMAAELCKVKLQQIAAMTSVLQGIADRVSENGTLVVEGRAAIQSEIQRSCRRLADYSKSGLTPSFYYPLDEAAFERAMERIEKVVDVEVDRFGDLQEELRSQLLGNVLAQASSDESNIDFFKNRLRRSIALNGRALVARSLGEIVRQYGLVDRSFNYGDEVVFPLYRVRGMSISYQMQRGLSTNLRVEWEPSR